MPDYKQGKIYTVRCKTDDTLIYVGCTTELLSRRCCQNINMILLTNQLSVFINVLMEWLVYWIAWKL